MTKYILAADIGGTKTDLGLYLRCNGVLKMVRGSTVRTSSYNSAFSILNTFLLQDAPNVEAACVGAAGPVIDGRVAGPNMPWTISEAELSTALEIPNLRLINDLVASAYGISLLNEDKLVTLQEGKPIPRGTRALIAPGTGLGESIMVHCGADYLPIPTEGGHADFSPADEEQIELLRYVKSKVGAHVSWERLASGPGLKLLFDFVLATGRGRADDRIRARMAHEDQSSVVAEEGCARGNSACVKALELYLAILGAEAGNLALKSLPTGGLYLGGGMPPKLLPNLTDGPFLEAFLHKGRISRILTDIPIKVMIDPKTALLGAASYAGKLSEQEHV